MITFAILVGIALLLLAILQLGYHTDWTGFAKHIDVAPSGQQVQPEKTLWDWMQLLIVPLVLAVGAFLLNFSTTRTEREIAQKRYENDQAIAQDKQREDLLQTYLDRLSELLLKEKLRQSEQDAEVRNVARTQTLTVLSQLDTKRRNYVLSFLREAKLVTPEAGKSIVTFHKADLSGADLTSVNLSNIDLSEANLSEANLSYANLSGANLSGADLSEANLSEANLSEANLSKADLLGADLFEASLFEANLSGAHLSGTNLSGAALWDANLSEANLVGANLSKANFLRANLDGVTLGENNLSGVILDEANLSRTKQMVLLPLSLRD